MTNIKHIAFIMDGNSTWANGKLNGYLEGMKNLGRIICEVNTLKIPFATCYAFSSENWFRPQAWIDNFMNLAIKFLEQDPIIQNVLEAGIRLKVIGNISKLPTKLQNLITKYEKETEKNNGTLMLLAMSYGSRDEIIRATQKLIENKAEISEQNISMALDTAGIPDPDLIIRTSGKQRLSNFLLWQAAYSELYFTDTLWPDFDKDELHKAINCFNARKRTYGR